MPLTIDASPGGVSILTGLPTDLFSRLFTEASPHSLQPGEELFHTGDAGDGCYRIRTGLIRIIIESAEGDELVVAFLGHGAMVGELAVIDGLPRSATVLAVKACELSFLSRRAFEDCMRAHPELYRCLVDSLAARLRETTNALAAASFLNSQGRLARALLDLVGVVGEDAGNGRILIAHEIRSRDLAAMAGIARENASRIVSDWRARRIVTRVSDRYCIEDITALRQEME